jgi:hypothetical protein
LKCPSEATIEGLIRHRLTGCRRKFGLSVDRGGDRMTITHACAVKNIENILRLRKMNTSWGLRDMDAKKMVKGPKILHCKFMAKRLSYIGEEDWRGCCKNNVINI